MGVWGKREGPGLPDPELGFRRGVSYYGAHFWKLVGANLLFVVCALPLVTLPGALCALNRVCVRIYRDSRCFLWSDFWEEFRSARVKALAPGLLFGLLLFWFATVQYTLCCLLQGPIGQYILKQEAETSPV